MSETDVLSKFIKTIPGCIDEQGIYPTPAIIRRNDGTLEIFAMAIEAKQIIQAAFANCLRAEIEEQIIALDSYCLPDQFTTLDSCLILFHLVRGQPARVGVLEYSWNRGDPITKEPVWDNPFWTTAYEALAKKLSEAFPRENA